MDFNILDERTWPLDNPDEVSIGRAFQVVGQQRFGGEWPEVAGSALVPLVAPLPPLEMANKVDRLRAWSLLPESRAKPPPTITTTRGSSIFFTAHNWQRAEEVLAPRIAAQDKVAACFSAVRSAIRDACLSGSLEARAQIYNGQTLVIKSHIWKTQRFIRWFSTGRASILEVLDQPFSSDEPTLWVYFSRTQLERNFSPATRTGVPKILQATSETLATNGRIHYPVTSRLDTQHADAFQTTSPPSPSCAEVASNDSRVRQTPQRARALKVITELFPHGVPDREELTDTQLNKLVADQFSTNAPSRDTILRAAGRKR